MLFPKHLIIKFIITKFNFFEFVLTGQVLKKGRIIEKTGKSVADYVL